MSKPSGLTEAQFLGRLLHHPDEISDGRGIDTGFFVDEDWVKVAEFAFEHARRHGKYPDPATVRRKFGVILDDQPEPLSYYADGLRERRAFYAVQDYMNEAGEALSKGHVGRALSTLDGGTRSVQSVLDSGAEEIIPIGVGAGLVEARYAKAKTGALLGVPYPWGPFTDATLGAHPGDLIVTAARVGVGKTWHQIIKAHHAWAIGGKRVLYITPELRPNALYLRLSAYIAEVPFELARSGKLSKRQEAEYLDILKLLMAEENFIVAGYNMAANLGHIEALVHQYEPDILYIDGFYLIDPRPTGLPLGRHEKRSEAADQVKIMANDLGIPIDINVQLNREQKKKKLELDLGRVYGTDVYAQNADTVFLLGQSPEMKARAEMKMVLAKNREGMNIAAFLNWDLNDMNFDLIEWAEGDDIKPSVATPVTSYSTATT